MNERTVDEVYASNSEIRSRLKDVISPLNDEQLYLVPEGEKWSIAGIVEHLTMVESGATRICAKLLSKAENSGMRGDGKIKITRNFVEKGNEIAGMKVEAPEIVQPSGNRTIAESMEAFDVNAEALNQLKPLFEMFDSNEFKFPHPFFGGMSAGEWVTMIGAHEARHLRQIKALAERI